MSKDLEIIYITSYGRSGSTLVDRIIGLSNNSISCGELINFWKKWLEPNYKCSCGEELNKCDFWQEVLKLTLNKSKISKSDIEHISTLLSSIINRRNALRILTESYSLSNNIQKEVAIILKRFYLAIASLSNAKYIIDSSKVAFYGRFLELAGLKIHGIHLVRDSRAVTYSQIRKRYSKEERKYTTTKFPLRTALGWNFYNFLSEKWKKISDAKFYLLKYEEMVKNPLILNKILPSDLHIQLDVTKGTPKFVLDETHIPAGNIFRFKRGEIVLKLDSEWKERLNKITYVTVTLITYPYLRKYGYI